MINLALDMANNYMVKKNLIHFSIVLSIFIFDRLSKYIVLEKSNNSETLDISLNSFININLVWNNGIAFGLLSFNQNIYYHSITLIIILITLLIIWFAHRSSGLEKISFLMITGGSLGNIFDRIYYSSVIDFIDLNYNNFHWFIFNVADIFITLGVIMLITLEFFRLKKT